MRRRVLVLPLVALILALLIVLSLVLSGGVPGSLLAPLASGIVAAFLTGGLGLWGIWMNLNHQIERDRLDRIRAAYAKMLQAAHRITQAADEATWYPQGRAFPGPDSLQLHYMASLDVLVKERAQFNPYHVEEALLDEARDLAIEAESAIFLEEGAGSAVISRWGVVEWAHGEFRKALSGTDAAATTEQRTSFLEAVDRLRDEAHGRLKRLT